MYTWSIALFPLFHVFGRSSPIRSCIILTNPISNSRSCVFSLELIHSLKSPIKMIARLDSISLRRFMHKLSITSSRGFFWIPFDRSIVRCWDHAVVTPAVSSLFLCTRYTVYTLMSLSFPRNVWLCHRPNLSFSCVMYLVWRCMLNPLDIPPGW